MEDKTKLIREIENVVDDKLTSTILFYMTEYKNVADYYFIADIFCHKCDYLALKIANELTETDREDSMSFQKGVNNDSQRINKCTFGF